MRLNHIVSHLADALVLSDPQQIVLDTFQEMS